MLLKLAAAADSNSTLDTRCPMGCHGNRWHPEIRQAGVVLESKPLRVDRRPVLRQRSTMGEQVATGETVFGCSLPERGDVTVLHLLPHLAQV